MIRGQNSTSDREIRDDGFLQKLADMSPALLYTFDVLEQRCIYINARSLDLVGYPPETILAMGADFMVHTLHPDDRAKLSEHFERLQVASDGTYLEIEYRMRHINGAWRWMSSRDTVFKRTSEGQVCQILGTAQDITDRKRTEEALSESEQRFQAFMHNNPTSAWMADEDGNILYLNSTYFRMFQFVQEDAIGKNISEIYPEEFAKQFLENNRQVLQTDRLLETTETAPRLDGSTGDFLVYKFPIKNILEKPIIGGIAIDITAHKQADKALKESELRSRKMFEEAPIGISAIDLKNKFIQANKVYCEMLGYSELELSQMTFADITYPEDINVEMDYIQPLFKGEISSYQIEKRYITKSGQIIWVNLTATAIFDLQGEPLYCFAMAENITSRKREEQRKATRYNVTRVLVESKTLVEAIPIVLQCLCESLGWQIGIIWTLDTSGNVLRYLDSWHSKTVNAEELIKLAQLTQFPNGVGLPGRVWADRTSCLIENLSEKPNFYRIESTARAGLLAGLAFPIQVGDEILGVIECFSDRVQSPDPDLLQMVQLIGNQIGQFMQQKRTEEALRESQELFQSFMKNSPIAAFIKDETGRHIYVNSWVERVYQRPQKDLIGKTDFELLPFDIAQQFRDNDLQVLANSQPLQILEKINHQDGEHYYMSFKFPFCNSLGEQLLAGVAIDVSDRIRAEETLRQREQELASIADAVPVLISYVDCQQRYRFNNRSYEEWFGISKTELNGKYLWEVMGESAYENIRPYVEQALSGKSVTFETKLCYQNVGIRYASVSYIPQFDSQQKVEGFVALVNDFTDRILAQEALRQSDERFRLAARAVSGVIYDWDVQTQGVYRSEGLYQLIGVRSEEVPQQRDWWLERIHPVDRLRVQDMMLSILASDRDRYASEYRVRHEDGRWIDVWDRGYLIRDPDGELIRVVGWTADITERKQAEAEKLQLLEQIETERELLEAVLQQMPAGVIVAEAPSGKIILRNERIQEIWRIPAVLPVEQIDRYRYQGFHLDGRPYQPHEWPLARSVRTGEVVTEEEIAFIRGDTTRGIMLVNSAPIRDSQGNIKAGVVTFYDISDRKQAEEALRQSEERFQLIARATNDVMWDFNVLTERMWWSDRVRSVFGYQPQQLGSNMEGWAERVHPEDIHRVEANYEKCLNSAESFWTDEYRFLRADGSYAYLLDRAYIIRDAMAKPVRVVGAMADISDRKQAEQALKERENRFITLFNGMEDWVLVYHLNLDDRPGKLIEINEQACKKLGYSREEMLSMSVADIIVPEVDSNTNVQRLLREKHVVVESIHRTKNGKNIPVEVSATLFTFNGLPTVQAICRDITSRKQTEKEKEQLLERERTAREEAEAANRIKDEFLAVLSHELRSPLNPILGWTSLLRKRQLDEQTTNRALETIERNAKLQTQLIEDLLDVSRILRGKMALNVAPVNLADTIEAALETVQLAAQAKNIQIRTLLGDRSEQVSGDSARLQQVIWNLLSNAVKFTPAGGRVEVSLIRDKSQAKIIVSDTGKGITPEFLPFVFDYFRQEDGKITRKFGGLGLGLAIVRHITELHGGTVRAESPGDGMGATFTVSLPLLISESAKIEDEKRESLASIDRTFPLLGWRILVVDDEPDVRDLLQVVLKQAGAEVIVATSATEALTIFDLDRPDVLISDIGMPEMDGYMLMRQIRNMPPEKGGQIPAIALTAYAGEFDRQQAIGAGFQQHISKPVEPQELIRAIVNIRN